MGTRSNTKVISVRTDENGQSEDVILASIYRQFDGYIEGMGKDLLEFMEGLTIVNGMSPFDQTERFANGAGCFAAQLIAELKDEPGSIYMSGPNDSQEYNYRIYFEWRGDGGWDGHEVLTRIEVESAVYGKVWSGTLEEFGVFVRAVDANELTWPL